MKRKALVLAAVCLGIVFIFSGCTGGCEDDDDCEGALVCTEGECVTSNEWSGQGLKGEFLLPVEVWEDEDFNVDLQIENMGEEVIAAGDLNVYLGGISLKTYGIGDDWTGEGFAYFSGSDLVQSKNKNELYSVLEEGDTIIPGGLEDITFGSDVSSLHVPAGQKDIKITTEATMCYPYKTTGVAQVCVGNIEPGEDYVCKSNEDKAIDSSRAPVKITKVYQAGAGKSQTFTIYFENQDDGIAYIEALAEDDTTNCVTSLEKSKKNKVQVSKVTLGNDQELTCTGDVSLAAGRVVCYCNDGLCAKEAVSEAPLSITLTYNYKDKVSKSFIVKGI